MEDKIVNKIASYQSSINELNNLKKHINDSIDDNLKFIIKTKHILNLELGIIKSTDKLDISKYTMNLILDEAIEKQKERINKLVDMLIEIRQKEGYNDTNNVQ